MFKHLEEKENVLRIHSFDGQTIWLDKHNLIYEVKYKIQRNRTTLFNSL